MIKVCHMTSAHNPEDVRIFHKECVSLAKAGYEVYLVERGDSYEKNGVHMVGVGEIPANRLKRMTQGAKKVYEAALALDADIYHFHDPELLPYGLKLKRAGKKVIFDSHEKYTMQLKSKPYLPRWATICIAKAYGIYEKYALKRLDAIIFPCMISGKNPFEGQCRRAVIINNAAIIGELYDRYDPNRRRRENTACYVGGLTEDRGITYDMQAASQAGIKLLLAGDFSPSAYGEQLQTMPEFSCVEYRGQLGRGEIADLLAESQVGLCTLLNRGQYFMADTFGIKVFEYLSMALPVVLSNSPFNCNMVEQYHFGICVDPENVDEIATAIRYLLDHPDEAKQMGENGRRAVKEEFNWGVEEQKLFALYADILRD